MRGEPGLRVKRKYTHHGYIFALVDFIGAMCAIGNTCCYIVSCSVAAVAPVPFTGCSG